MRHSLPLVVLFIASQSAAAIPNGTPKLGKTVKGETTRAQVRKVTESWWQTVSVQPASPQYVLTPFLPLRRSRHTGPVAERTVPDYPYPSGFGSIGEQQPQISFSSSFDGPDESDSGNTYPPDGAIASSPQYVVAVINSVIGIYTKSGAAAAPVQQLSSFFSSLGLPGGYSDPRAVFDPNTQRFIIVDDLVGYSGFFNYNVLASNILVAVSQTSDPTGSWDKYAFNTWGTDPATGASTWADFPAVGLSSTALYIATDQYDACNLLDSASCIYSDAWVLVISLSDLYSGDPSPTVTTFRDVQTAGGIPAVAIEPALTIGPSSQEFLAAAFFSLDPNAISSSVLNLFAINTSGTPTITPLDLPVPSYTLPPNASQAGTSIPIITNDFRLINAVWANNTLWCAQNVASDTGTFAVVRWYKIGISSLAHASMEDSGTIAGSGNAFYPALIPEANGDIVVVFGTSSTSQFASAAYTGRSVNDAAGTMRAPVIYRSGLATYSQATTDSSGNPIYRWGDYSGIAIDPMDGSAWGLAEYSKGPDPQYSTAVIQMVSAPAMSASPSSLSFADEHLGSSQAPLTLQLINQGTDAVLLGSGTLTGKDPASFSLLSDTCSGISLAVGSMCSQTFTFSPTTTGSKGAELLLPQAIGGKPQGTTVVPIQGNAISNAAVDLVPSQLTFPAQATGTTSTSQSILLSNTGTGTLGITGIKASGDFSETDNCGNQVPNGANCKINVTFSPTSAGMISGVLSITDDAEGSPHSVALSGTGAAPQVTFSPSKIDFGQVNVGTTSSAQSVTLTNTGTVSLTISTINTTDWQFGVSDKCPHFIPALAAGASCTISVTFSPISQATDTAALHVNDNAPGSPQSVALSGQGSQTAVSLSTSGLSFGNQNVGTTSAEQDVTISNIGQNSLHISVISITGTNSADFGDTSNCVGTLAPGTACSVRVTFSPSAASIRTATLSVSDDAVGSPQTVALSGTGAASAASLSSASLQFGNEDVGATSPLQTITFTNTGNAALSIASMSISGPNAGDFGFVSSYTSCTTTRQLSPGSNCSIALNFTPAGNGSRSATLSITDSAPGSPRSVSLTGNGQDFNLAIASGTSGTATVSAGGAVTYNLTLSPLGGFNQVVTLVCTGAPQQATCAVSPTPIDLNGTSPAAITITVTTSASGGTQANTSSPPKPSQSAALLLTILAPFGVPSLWALLRRKRLWLRWISIAMIVFPAALPICSCNTGTSTGGSPHPGSPGTPAGTYTLLVTGTAGGVSHSISLSLKVN